MAIKYAGAAGRKGKEAPELKLAIHLSSAARFSTPTLSHRNVTQTLGVI